MGVAYGAYVDQRDESSPGSPHGTPEAPAAVRLCCRVAGTPWICDWQASLAAVGQTSAAIESFAARAGG